MTTQDDKNRIMELIAQKREETAQHLLERAHQEFDVHDRQTVDALKGGKYEH